MSEKRLDALLAERGLVPSRTRAAEEVRAGRVRVGRDGRRPTRPSELVAADAELILEEAARYVSRGGIKLANALDALGLEVSGRECLDVGASTGGFTDCLLQRGAARVIALDVAYGQLDWGLRNDERVIVVERANARELAPGDLPFAPSLAVVDVSFISLQKVLPSVVESLAAGADLLAMVKPQFELGRERVGRGGVVRDPADRRDAIRAVADAIAGLGLTLLGLAPSGLPGPKGNVETFVHARLGAGVQSGFDLAAELERIDA